jgi:AcrR family transcriptional regulator
MSSTTQSTAEGTADTDRESTVPTRRERARAATVAEIKQTALDLMREHGTTDVRFTDIARVMGLTPPALYRYYADRDELLTDLITDGYSDLAAALAAALGPDEPAPAPSEQLRRVAQAYRDWAKADPQRFALIFGLPVPGYAAPQEGPTVEAAQRAMANLAEVVHRAAAAGALGDPLVGEVDPVLEQCLMADQKTGVVAKELSPARYQAMIHGWAALHGFVCLEAYGHFDWFPSEVPDVLFRYQVDLVGRALGFPPLAG